MTNPPDWLNQQLSGCPTSGGGVNLWIYGMAGKLKAFMSHDQAKQVLRNAVAGCGRQVRDFEIDRALQRSEALKLSSDGYEQFTTADSSLCAQIDDRYEISGADFMDQSPIQMDGQARTRAILRRLFRPDETICLAREHLYEAKLHPMSALPEDTSAHSFVVPSPMKPEGGTTDDGKPSQRSKNGVVHRRYVVADFDQDAPDQHLRRINFLRNYAPLVAVVWSGGKGYHGWFLVENKPSAAVRQFIELVCKLGGDKAAWQPHQVFRLPDGWRYANLNKPGSKASRQSCIYFDPPKL